MKRLRRAGRAVGGFAGWIALVIAVVALVVAGTRSPAGGGGGDQGDSTLFEVLDRGEITLGITSEVAPFGFVDDDGELTGFDIDIGKLLAKSLFEDESKVEFKRVSFPSRWPAVNTGEVDAGIMVTTIWPDRMARVNFTRGYIRSGIAVLARNDLDIENLEDLNESRYTMAILDTPSEFDLMEQDLPNMETLVFGSESDMLSAVRSGRAEALLIDLPVATWREEQLPNMQTLGVVGPQTQNAIFLRQNDFQWWWYLDSFVAEMRCGSLYEDYVAIYRKWFDVAPPPRESCLAFSGQDLQEALRSQ